MKMKASLFIAGILILMILEIARVYFIMPFPGSQYDDTIQLAYFLHQNIFWLRLLALAIVLYPGLLILKSDKQKLKIISSVLLVMWLAIVYLFNFRFMADKMFYQPENKVFASPAGNTVPVNSLVLGIFINGEARAYPIEIIGYHHQVRDTVGNVSVMVTYCTVCRTGRVYKPEVNGQPENFRLVGMDHFNAMFEDKTTQSWWRQVSGEAIEGTLKGSVLPEIPSEQMTLESWLKRYPHSLILQPDSKFNDEYVELKDYDEGKKVSALEGRDSLSWKRKSWVVGISSGLFSKAYDWNDLTKLRVINDEIGGLPIVVALENDSASFHVWQRNMDFDTLRFEYDENLKSMVEVNTKSVWGWNGVCREGELHTKQLTPVQSYQEYWHSWESFHPNTTRYLATP